jgi:hypothetical protein
MIAPRRSSSRYASRKLRVPSRVSRPSAAAYDQGAGPASPPDHRIEPLVGGTTRLVPPASGKHVSPRRHQACPRSLPPSSASASSLAMASAAATAAVRAVRRASCSTSTTSCRSQPAGPRASTTCAPPARSATSGRASGPCYRSDPQQQRVALPFLASACNPASCCLVRPEGSEHALPTFVIDGAEELVAALRAA